MKTVNSIRKKATILFTLALMITATDIASAQCTADTECDAGQICSDGTCQTPETEAGPPAPETKAEATAQTEPSQAQIASTVEKERIKPLWISGLAAFGAIYIANIVVSGVVAAQENKSKAAGYAAIPFVGQFLSIANDSDEYPIADYKGPMILGAVLQFVAAGVFTAGMVIKRDPKDKQTARAPRFWLTPTPMGTTGAGAVFTMTHF